MEFSEVLDRRRTYRDYSDREVNDEILDKVISAAFKAPTNDHLACSLASISFWRVIYNHCTPYYK